MSVTSIGNGMAAPVELPQDRGAMQRTQAHAVRQRAELIRQFEAAIPGNGPQETKTRNILFVAADLEKISRAFNKKLQYVVDHQSNEVTVKVIDRETDKVIKELPPKELQRVHRKLRETIGFLFDERV